MPDRYGDPRRRYRPYLWRNASNTIRPGLELVYTPDYVRDFEAHAPLVLERSAIAERFAGAHIIEVRHRLEDGVHRMEPVPFDAGLP
jgi:hypothetical protein